MADFLSTLRQQPLLTDGAMGSYLYELTGRQSERNHIYETLPADQPQIITDVYFSYLQAGAQCLKTNTFGANAHKLKRFGQENRVSELNKAGVQVARDAARDFAARSGLQPAFVIGSVGPVGNDQIEIAEVEACLQEQIITQIQAGVDAIMFETYTSLPHLQEVVSIARSQDADLPIIALSSPQHAEDESWKNDPAAFAEAMLEAGATIIGVNCCSPWDAQTYIEELLKTPAVASGQLMLSAMPNGGGYQRVDNRFMSSTNPEVLGRQARTFLDMGVHLIGGCCEVHPPHIQEMGNYLRSKVVSMGQVDVRLQHVTSQAQPAAGPGEKRQNGPFSQRLFDGEFCVSVEVLPPRGTNPKLVASKLTFVQELAASGLAHAIDVTDGSRGIPLMPPGDFIQLVHRESGWTPGQAPLEFIPHFAARDLNTMGIQSRLMGYHFAGIHNVLYITGDPPKMSPTYPRSTAVFDLDSAEMIRVTQQCLNCGVDFGGQSLGKHDDPRMHFTVGVGFEPEAVNQERELQKLERKITNGADYLMTQPAFRFEPLKVLDPYRDRVKILVGVMVLTSLDHAKRVGNVPGVTIPDTVFERLSRYDDPADQGKAALDFAAEQCAWVKANGYAGLYLMSPSSHRPIINVLEQGLA